MQNVSIHDRKVSEYLSLNVKYYPAGSVIFEEGKTGKSAFIVQSGIIEIGYTEEYRKVLFQGRFGIALVVARCCDGREYCPSRWRDRLPSHAYGI